MFRGFQGLARLRDVDVVVRERLVVLLSGQVLNCDQRVHEGRHHAIDLNETEDERREAKLEWAEEIKSEILGTRVEIR